MNRKQFGIRTAFAAITIFAVVLASIAYSHRLGVQTGYVRGFNTAMNQRLDRMYEDCRLPMEYAIDDVMGKAFPNVDANIAVARIVKLLSERAKPETWDFVGGYGTMETEKNEVGQNILIVENTIPVHLEVSRILDDLRGAAPGIKDRSFVKKLYESTTTPPKLE